MVYRVRVRVRVRGCLSAFSARGYKKKCSPRVTNGRSRVKPTKSMCALRLAIFGCDVQYSSAAVGTAIVRSLDYSSSLRHSLRLVSAQRRKRGVG